MKTGDVIKIEDEDLKLAFKRVGELKKAKLVSDAEFKLAMEKELPDEKVCECIISGVKAERDFDIARYELLNSIEAAYPETAYFNTTIDYKEFTVELRENVMDELKSARQVGALLKESVGKISTNSWSF